MPSEGAPATPSPSTRRARSPSGSAGERLRREDRAQPFRSSGSVSACRTHVANQLWSRRSSASTVAASRSRRSSGSARYTVTFDVFTDVTAHLELSRRQAARPRRTATERQEAERTERRRAAAEEAAAAPRREDDRGREGFRREAKGGARSRKKPSSRPRSTPAQDEGRRGSSTGSPPGPLDMLSHSPQGAQACGSWATISRETVVSSTPGPGTRSISCVERTFPRGAPSTPFRPAGVKPVYLRAR